MSYDLESVNVESLFEIPMNKCRKGWLRPNGQ